MICPKCQEKQKKGACFCHQCGWGLIPESGAKTLLNQLKKEKGSSPFRPSYIQAFFMGIIILSIFGISLFLIGILLVK